MGYHAGPSIHPGVLLILIKKPRIFLFGKHCKYLLIPVSEQRLELIPPFSLMLVGHTETAVEEENIHFRKWQGALLWCLRTWKRFFLIKTYRDLLFWCFPCLQIIALQFAVISREIECIVPLFFSIFLFIFLYSSVYNRGPFKVMKGQKEYHSCFNDNPSWGLSWSRITVLTAYMGFIWLVTSIK